MRCVHHREQRNPGLELHDLVRKGEISCIVYFTVLIFSFFVFSKTNMGRHSFSEVLLEHWEEMVVVARLKIYYETDGAVWIDHSSGLLLAPGFQVICWAADIMKLVWMLCILFWLPFKTIQLVFCLLVLKFRVCI